MSASIALAKLTQLRDSECGPNGQNARARFELRQFATHEEQGGESEQSNKKSKCTKHNWVIKKLLGVTARGNFVRNLAHKDWAQGCG